MEKNMMDKVSKWIETKGVEFLSKMPKSLAPKLVALMMTGMFAVGCENINPLAPNVNPDKPRQEMSESEKIYEMLHSYTQECIEKHGDKHRSEAGGNLYDYKLDANEEYANAKSQNDYSTMYEIYKIELEDEIIEIHMNCLHKYITESGLDQDHNISVTGEYTFDTDVEKADKFQGGFQITEK